MLFCIASPEFMIGFYFSPLFSAAALHTLYDVLLCLDIPLNSHSEFDRTMVSIRGIFTGLPSSRIVTMHSASLKNRSRADVSTASGGD